MILKLSLIAAAGFFAGTIYPYAIDHPWWSMALLLAVAGVLLWRAAENSPILEDE